MNNYTILGTDGCSKAQYDHYYAQVENIISTEFLRTLWEVVAKVTAKNPAYKKDGSLLQDDIATRLLFQYSYGAEGWKVLELFDQVNGDTLLVRLVHALRAEKYMRENPNFDDLWKELDGIAPDVEYVKNQLVFYKDTCGLDVPQSLFDKLAEAEENDGKWTKKSVLSQIQSDAYHNQSDKEGFFRTLNSRSQDKDFLKYATEIFDLGTDGKENRRNVLAKFNGFVKAKRLERKQSNIAHEQMKKEMAFEKMQRQALEGAADMEIQVRRYSAKEKLRSELAKVNLELKS